MCQLESLPKENTPANEILGGIADEKIQISSINCI